MVSKFQKDRFTTDGEYSYTFTSPGTFKCFCALHRIKDVPADKLRSLLGLSDVTYVANDRPLALIDSTLA